MEIKYGYVFLTEVTSLDFKKFVLHQIDRGEPYISFVQSEQLIVMSSVRITPNQLVSVAEHIRIKRAQALFRQQLNARNRARIHLRDVNKAKYDDRYSPRVLENVRDVLHGEKFE